MTDSVIVTGAGGVGKTTLSAALGASLAARGKRVLVLTIDPAKRLADALGIDELGDDAQRVGVAAGGGIADDVDRIGMGPGVINDRIKNTGCFNFVKCT